LNLKAFAAPATPTLADLLDRLAVADLPARRRTEMASAVRVVARALGVTPADVPAHPGYLRQRLATLNPISVGIAPRRWANVLSLLRRALEIALVVRSPASYLVPLSPAWATLLASVPCRSIRHGLGRFARYCSAQAIPPEAVDDEVLAGFGDALAAESIRKAPETIVRDTRWSWNRAVRDLPHWPQRPLTVPPRKDRYGLPLETFPPSFAADAQAWLDHLGGKKSFVVRRGFRPLRPATLTQRRAQLREVASALVIRGYDPASIRSLADLVQPAAVAEAMQFFFERAGGKVTGRMQVLAWTLIGIARHWVRLSPEQLLELRGIASECQPEHRGLTAKNRAVLRRFKSDAAKLALLDLPFKLLRELKTPKPWSGRDAQKVETALMLHLLTRAPVRVANLARIEIDRHLVRRGPDGRQLVLVVPPEEVKNRAELVHPLSELTADLLQLYVEHARPQLAQGPTPFLFPGVGTTPRPIGTRAVLMRMRKVTERHLGFRLSPHQFRHFCARVILDANPGAHELVRALLGDRSIETIIRYYAGLEQETAVEHYDEVIEQLQRKARRAK
jgi:integrase